MIYFYIVFCLLFSVLDCEHLERKDCILFIPCTQQIKSVFKESWVSGENLGNRVWAEGIIKEDCSCFLEPTKFSKWGLWTSSISIIWELFRMHFLQAWPQTYWIRTSVLVRALQRSRGNRLFMHIERDLLHWLMSLQRPTSPKSAERVSKLETQESWWWSSCPKIGRLKTQEEPMFPFKSKDRGMLMFQFPSSQRGRNFCDLCFNKPSRWFWGTLKFKNHRLKLSKSQVSHL